MSLFLFSAIVAFFLHQVGSFIQPKVPRNSDGLDHVHGDAIIRTIAVEEDAARALGGNA